MWFSHVFTLHYRFPRCLPGILSAVMLVSLDWAINALYHPLSHVDELHSHRLMRAEDGIAIIHQLSNKNTQRHR